MNPRTTVWLALVVLLVGAFIYFYEIEGEADRKAVAEAGSRIFASLEADSIDALEFETQDGIAARFERREGRWRLVSPVEGPGDALALDAIASALANLSREGAVDSPGELEQYGLGDGTRRIRFEAEGRAFGLRVGRTTPVGGHVYVLAEAPPETLPGTLPEERASEAPVAYVASYRLNPLSRNLADLRDREIFPFEVADASGVSLSWPGGAVALAREDEVWRVKEPIEGPVDDPTIRELLMNLSSLRAKGFLDAPDEPTEDARSALEAPELSVTVTIAGESKRLVIGGRHEGDPIVRGPGGRLFTIAAERLADFPRDVSSYRFRTLSEFEVSSAREITLDFEDARRGSHRFVARLGETGWASEERPDLDSARMTDLVGALASLRATSIVAEEMGAAERASLGLEPPRVAIRVASEKGDEPGDTLAEVAIGRLDPDRGLFAQSAGDPIVYLLEADEAAAIPISLEAFEGRFREQGEEQTEEEEPPGDELAEDPMGDLGLP